MAQLHCYVPDEIADLFKQKAKEARLSTSKYLALLVKQKTAGQWPDDYFDLAGSWQGEPIMRPEQLNFEQRMGFE
jgi:hypothetical protein